MPGGKIVLRPTGETLCTGGLWLTFLCFLPSVFKLRPALGQTRFGATDNASVPSRLFDSICLSAGAPTQIMSLYSRIELISNAVVQVPTEPGLSEHIIQSLKFLHYLPVELDSMSKYFILPFQEENCCGPDSFRDFLSVCLLQFEAVALPWLHA